MIDGGFMDHTIKGGSNAKSITVSAVITRADGTIQNLGAVGYYHKNPLRMAWWKIKRFVTNFFKKD